MIDNIWGNVSTIATFIAVVFEPYLSYLGVDETLIHSTIMALIGLVIVWWSASNPNNLKIFGNDKELVEKSDVGGDGGA